MNDDIQKMVDNQAESGVIATLVVHPEFILHSDCLKAGYFYNQDNACVYWQISELYKRGIDTIDAYNISNMIASNAAVKRTTEQYNLPSMQEYIELCSVAARSSLQEYMLLVKRVVELSFKRDLYKKLNECKNDCVSGANLETLNSSVYDKLDSLTEKYITGEEIKTIGDTIDEVWDEIDGEDVISGLPSKFEAVNNYFNYERSELVLVSGRMKAGKSAYAMNEAIHMLQIGIPTVYFDTEMQEKLFVIRMLSNISGVELKKIKDKKCNAEEHERVVQAKNWLKKQPFVHIYSPSFSEEKIYSTCKILQRKIGLGFVVYDYIKSNMTDSSAQYNELGARCDFLKNTIAGELNLPVLAGAQLNRQGQIADSDKLERYCSVSMRWEQKTSEEYLSDGEDCGNFKLMIKLNRLGEQMADDEYIDMKFDGNRMRIEQAQQHKSNSPF